MYRSLVTAALAFAAALPVLPAAAADKPVAAPRPVAAQELVSPDAHSDDETNWG